MAELITNSTDSKLIKVYAKWERKTGMSLPDEFRAAIEHNLGWNDEEVGLADLEGALTDFFSLLEKLSYLPSPKTPKRLPKKRYLRSFHKRLHLVDFIIGKQLTLRNHSQRSLTRRKRINWKQICGFWNEAHPYDIMTPDVLKATYYRTIAEEDIQRGYLVTSAVKEARGYRQTYQDGGWIVDSDGFFNGYEEFVKSVEELMNICKVRPNKFEVESFQGIIDTLREISEIRNRQLLESKKRLEELTAKKKAEIDSLRVKIKEVSHNEKRAHTQEV